MTVTTTIFDSDVINVVGILLILIDWLRIFQVVIGNVFPPPFITVLPAFTRHVPYD